MNRIFFCAILIAGALRADSLEAVLHRMDEGAKKFKSVSANLDRTNYNAVLRESTKQSGDLKLMRRGKGGVMGVLHFNPPDETTIGFNGRTVKKYYPNTNQVDVFDIGKNASQIDQFILLTFGAAGSELTQSYDLKFAGSETISSMPCSHVVLVPKSPEARKYATQIEMWIPENKSYSIQEKVTQPSGNYDLNAYTDVKLNPALADSAFELKIPANAKVINLK